MLVKLTLAFAIVLTFELSKPVPCLAQDAVALVASKQPIPTGFKTYSVFLICNPQWLDPAKNSGLFQLYRQFQNFGRAIGGENAAIWFWKSDSYERSDASLAQIVDVERSVRFCKAWKLKPSEGPHLVITSTYPDEAHLATGLLRDHAIYKLGDMSPPDVSSLLAKLTDQLVVNGKVDSSTDASPAVALWVRLLSATQQTVNQFGCAWSFKITAGPVSADLKSCGTT